MRIVLAALTAILVSCSGCQYLGVRPNPDLTPSEQQMVGEDIRNFMQTVAQNVTKNGPSAWRRHFEDVPSFFMAVNGQLQFSDSESAKEGVEKVAQVFKKIELRWGDDLSADPLTVRLTSVRASYHET